MSRRPTIVDPERSCAVVFERRSTKLNGRRKIHNLSDLRFQKRDGETARLFRLPVDGRLPLDPPFVFCHTFIPFSPPRMPRRVDIAAPVAYDSTGSGDYFLRREGNTGCYPTNE